MNEVMERELVHVIVKNVSKYSIELPEIGGYELKPGHEVDMMDESLPNGHYEDTEAVIRALTKLSSTVLYQELHAGNITYRLGE